MFDASALQQALEDKRLPLAGFLFTQLKMVYQLGSKSKHKLLQMGGALVSPAILLTLSGEPGGWGQFQAACHDEKYTLPSKNSVPKSLAPAKVESSVTFV